MANASSPQATPGQAWLISQPGSQVQFRYAVAKDTTSVGRGPDNDVVIQGPDAASVSLHHLEIRRSDSGFRIHDLESTNGTFLNGERITDGDLHPPASIRLGTQGPELAFVIAEESEVHPLDSTQVIPESIIEPRAAAAGIAPAGTYEGLLTKAVERAREARAQGVSGETMTIMRDALHQALRHTGKRFRLLIYILAAGLVAITASAGWKIAKLNGEKTAIDRRIQDVETQLQKAQSRAEADNLINQLDTYQGEAEQLQRNLLYRVGIREPDFVTDEIRRLMAEFGSEVYSVPPEFTERVKHYIEQYQGPNHSLMSRALGEAARQVSVIKHVLEQEHLPPDLAYVPLVESALADDQSEAGAAGPWQFTVATAKGYGLRVDETVDERKDAVKETRAACRYLRELIVDFGTGSSVMLALAAYNLGPSKVKQAVMKTVQDPIKQRNFWYLYRTKSLPAETREYVPKVMAAIIIGRNPARFGF